MKDRSYYLDILHQHIKNPRMVAHCLASEAVMRALALHFGQNADEWGIAGLLHDVDAEQTADQPKRHGLVAMEILKDELPQHALQAIAMHNDEATGLKRNTQLQHALAAGETITGLIFATAMVYPDRKISSVKPKSVVKRMKEKHFAASVKRQNIMECEQLGLTIEQFAVMALQALAPIETQLGF